MINFSLIYMRALLTRKYIHSNLDKQILKKKVPQKEIGAGSLVIIGKTNGDVF
jgi:hypothetical protein